MEIKPFTFYFLSGERTVGFGTSVSSAFRQAGFGGSAIVGVDWYESGITNSHYYENGRWMPRLRLSNYEGEHQAVDVENLSEQELYRIAKKSSSLSFFFTVTQTSCVTLGFKSGKFGTSYRQYLTVLCAERIGDDCNSPFEWGTLGALFFDSGDYENAVKAFKAIAAKGLDHINDDVFAPYRNVYDIRTIGCIGT